MSRPTCIGGLPRKGTRRTHRIQAERRGCKEQAHATSCPLLPAGRCWLPISMTLMYTQAHQILKSLFWFGCSLSFEDRSRISCTRYMQHGSLPVKLIRGEDFVLPYQDPSPIEDLDIKRRASRRTFPLYPSHQIIRKIPTLAGNRNISINLRSARACPSKRLSHRTSDIEEFLTVLHNCRASPTISLLVL